MAISNSGFQSSGISITNAPDAKPGVTGGTESGGATVSGKTVEVVNHPGAEIPTISRHERQPAASHSHSLASRTLAPATEEAKRTTRIALEGVRYAELLRTDRGAAKVYLEQQFELKRID